MKAQRRLISKQIFRSITEGPGHVAVRSYGWGRMDKNISKWE